MNALLDHIQPTRLTLIGFGGLAVIAWLMMFKPFSQSICLHALLQELTMFKKILKWIGLGFGVIVGLLLVLIAAGAVFSRAVTLQPDLRGAGRKPPHSR